MIRHIVFFSLKQSEDIATAENSLRRLKDIPEAEFFEVGRNSKTDALSNEIDLVVHGEFVDEAALARFKQHAYYQEAITVVRPLRNLRYSADYHFEKVS